MGNNQKYSIDFKLLVVGKYRQGTCYKLFCSNEYKEMTPVEAFNSLLDKGIYHASSRSFYRILKRFNALTHRTETKSGTSRLKPAELKTFMTDQLFSG